MPTKKLLRKKVSHKKIMSHKKVSLRKKVSHKKIMSHKKMSLRKKVSHKKIMSHKKMSLRKKSQVGKGKMSREYCIKTPCKKMGFSQKASCRKYKNCYI